MPYFVLVVALCLLRVGVGFIRASLGSTRRGAIVGLSLMLALGRRLPLLTLSLPNSQDGGISRSRSLCNGLVLEVNLDSPQ